MKQATQDIINNAVLETLEGRRHFSSVAMTNGVLVLAGDANKANHLEVNVTKNGTTIQAEANNVTKTYRMKDVKSLRVIGGNKSDTVDLDNRVKACALVATGAGNDTIDAAAGNDTILSGSGSDVVYGRDGNDFINSGGDKGDKVDAGKGDDPKKAASTKKGNNVTITSFTLIDADTDKVIAGYENMAEGATLNLAKLPHRHLNIRANVSVGGHKGSVLFTLNGSELRHVENIAAFSLAGNIGSNYRSWTPKVGQYVLTATPFSGKNAHGKSGETKTISFTVVDQPASKPATNTGGTPVQQPKPPPPPPPPSSGGTVETPKPPADDSEPPTEVNQSGSPTGSISLIERTINAGHAIHVNALGFDLKGGDEIHAQYKWDFGDPGSKYNTLPGWNAAHIYSDAGTYTITLSITNQAGKTSVVKTQVTVKASERRAIYVSNDGDDSNSGSSPDNAVNTLARASDLVGDNTEILFQRGDVFNTPTSLVVGSHNVVIGAYGTGDRPVLKYTGGAKAGSCIISVNGAAQDVTVRDLTFDSIAPALEYSNAVPNGVMVGGTNVVVLNNQFLNVSDAINCNQAPQGVLGQENVAPLMRGVRGYFVWAQGTDQVYLGNSCVDSYCQHVIRSAGLSRMLVAYNNFSNPVDSSIKATVNVQKGDHVYVAGNTLSAGPLQVGPLGNADGLADKGARTKFVVLEDNRVTGTMIIVKHGAEHVMLRDNVVKEDNNTSISIEGYDPDYQRATVDIWLDHNTGVNNGDHGNFLYVHSGGSAITVTNNLYVAPKLVPGLYSAAPVYVAESSLKAFRVISGNVWPAPNGTPWTEGGSNYVGASMNQDGYKTPAEWEATTQVMHDQFVNITLDDDYDTSVGGVTAGSSLSKAA